MKSLIGLFFKAVSFMISRLPRRTRDTLGDLIGLLWFDVFRIRRKVALENLAIAFPEKSEAERTRLARMSLRHMGRTIMDFTLFPFFKEADVDRHYVFEGLENLEGALAKGGGAIMLTLHLGNGDFATAALSRHGLPMNLISKEFKSRWLNEMWFGMRKRHGTRFISPEKSSFEILRALRRNEVVIFVLDQFMGPPVGVRTRFFGKETGTAAGLALMATRTGAPVIPCYTYRREDGMQVATFEPAVESPEGLDLRPKDEMISILTQIYTDKLEAMVRRHPEQWMWIHRRWKDFRD